MGYIYKITNKLNNKCYIGKTERTIEERWQEHCRPSRQKLNLPLYKAFAKYGIENFTVEEIEQCDTSLLDEREIYWISYFNSYGENGYNCTGGGEGGIKTYEEDIDEIIARYLAGERLDLLCKEYHHDYASIRPKIIAKGIVIDTNAGPKKLSKQVAAIDPKTKEIVAIYDSISAAGRALCKEGKNPRAVSTHIGKQKNTNNICHGFLWKTID